MCVFAIDVQRQDVFQLLMNTANLLICSSTIIYALMVTFCSQFVLIYVYFHSSAIQCARDCAHKSVCKAMQFKNGRCLLYDDVTKIPCGESAYVIIVSP